jgi:hypothetical protein
MGKFAELAARYLASLFEAHAAGLSRAEWLSLNGISAEEWHQVQYYMIRKGIKYPHLAGMRRPHRRRWQSRPEPVLQRAARPARPVAAEVVPSSIAQTFEIVVGV